MSEGSRTFNLDAMFKPRSIAVIGATTDFTKLNGRVLRFLMEYRYQGRILPINPKYSEIKGLPCYPDLASVPGEIDLAIVAMGAAGVPPIIRQCAERGVKAVTVFGAGFAEIGDDVTEEGKLKKAEGKRLQEELRQAALDGEIALDGPNCAGLIGVREKVIGTFNSAMDRGVITPGTVSFVAQSGALGTYMFAAAQDAGVGFDYWVSTGNEAVLGFADFVSYFAKQETTRTIIAYMEDARDGEGFKKCAIEALEAGKPLIILKVGESDAGSKAVASHTGALAGSDKVYSAIFHQTGVIRARDVEGLFDLANVCATPKYPKGNRTAIITISGGAASLMCDRCEEVGLEVAKLNPETEAALRAAPDFPAFATTHNPVDVTAELVAKGAKLLKKPLEITLADPNVDCLVIFLGMQVHNGEELARTIVEAAAGTDKTVIVNWIAAPEISVKILREAHIPVFPDPGRGVRSLGALVNYVQRRQRYMARKAAAKGLPGTPAKTLKAAKAIIAKARASNATNALSESEGKQLLALYGIPTPTRHIVTSAKDAAKAAKKMGFPVVMKIVSADILHKTEAGGVRLGVKDAREAEAAFNDIMKSARAYNKKAKLEGVLVEEMVTDAEQVIVGFKQDRLFGPAITMGMGGIYVELFRDASLRVAPFDADEAMAMIKETKAYKLLTGFRGAKLRDVTALTKVIVAVVRLALDFREEIAEFDVNPVMVLPKGKGVRAVDAAVVLR